MGLRLQALFYGRAGLYPFTRLYIERRWDGGTKWQSTTLMSMLENEKYKGDALLQKSYTVDFLTKKRTQNKGEIQMYYVEDDHEAIIPKRIWECVQLEIERRRKYLEEHGTNSYSPTGQKAIHSHLK